MYTEDIINNFIMDTLLINKSVYYFEKSTRILNQNLFYAS